MLIPCGSAQRCWSPGTSWKWPLCCCRDCHTCCPLLSPRTSAHMASALLSLCSPQMPFPCWVFMISVCSSLRAGYFSQRSQVHSRHCNSGTTFSKRIYWLSFVFLTVGKSSQLCVFEEPRKGGFQCTQSYIGPMGSGEVTLSQECQSCSH